MSSAGLRGLGRALALALPAALCACGGDDGTGPDGGEVDVLVTAETVEEMADKFFTENAAVKGMNVMGPCALATGLGGGFGTPEVASAAIPFPFLGKTVVYNTGSAACEVDEARTGAPPNGVRVILYETDGTGQLVLPSVEIGHVDVLNAGTAMAPQGRLTAAVGGATLVDGTATGSITLTAIDLDVSGTFSDGVSQLDFSAGVALSGNPADPNLSGNLSASSPGVTLTGSFSKVGGNDTTFVDVVLQIQGQELVEVEGTVDGDGNLFAGMFFGNDEVGVVSGNLDSRQVGVTNAVGGNLSPTELGAVEGAFGHVGQAFNASAGMVGLATGGRLIL